MKLAVYFTHVGVNPASIAGKPVLVLDILRATTTIGGQRRRRPQAGAEPGA
jgi:hypothetical protein